MIRNIFMGVIALTILALAVTAASAQGVLKGLTDSARVYRMAQGIADFDLPAGYRADYAVEMMDYSIVAYMSADGHGHVAFLQAPPGIIDDGAVLTGAVMTDRTESTWTDETFVDTDERIVRDHPATLTVSDRTNGEGVRYRNLNLVFQGRNGTVLLAISAPVDHWNEADMQAFIASIR